MEINKEEYIIYHPLLGNATLGEIFNILNSRGFVSAIIEGFIKTHEEIRKKNPTNPKYQKPSILKDATEAEIKDFMIFILYEIWMESEEGLMYKELIPISLFDIAMTVLKRN